MWQGANGWHPPVGTIGPPPLTQIDVGNTLFVMTNGNDATGTRERFDLPYATPWGAIVDALAGDTIVVYEGSYTNPLAATPPNLLQDDVNWEFVGNPTISYTGTAAGALFDDGVNGAGGAVTSFLEGIATIVNTGSDATNRVLNIDNASSIVWTDAIMRNDQSGLHTVRVNNAGADIQLITVDVRNTHATVSKGVECVDATRLVFRGGSGITGVNTLDSIVDISGGILKLLQTKVDNTSGAGTAEGIEKTGGTLVLDDVVIPNALGGSIVGAAGQAVKVYSAVAENAVQATLVEEVNTVTVSPLVI